MVGHSGEVVNISYNPAPAHMGLPVYVGCLSNEPSLVVLSPTRFL